uniref:hypothetical protein n=1 Tax=Agrobacterium fabrum TaxID=1176649 RepID=UPI0021BD375A|nr:hypothetical protein [Agrobacterium fabrum]UVY99654.1 hypothetical protein K4M20_00381 [Agrobacterium fabrum]
MSEIEDWSVTEVTATDALILLDLRTTGLLRLGVSTDAARGKEHQEGQRLSESIFRSYAVDGLLYSLPPHCGRLRGGLRSCCR